MDVCCSHDGRRHLYMQISWDVIAIVGEEEVAALLGTRGAMRSRGKATEDTDEVALECLDGFFSHVT